MYGQDDIFLLYMYFIVMGFIFIALLALWRREAKWYDEEAERLQREWEKEH